MTCVIERDTANHYEELGRQEQEAEWKQDCILELIEQLLDGENAYSGTDEDPFIVKKEQFSSEFFDQMCTEDLFVILLKIGKGEELGKQSNEIEKMLIKVAEQLAENEVL